MRFSYVLAGTAALLLAGCAAVGPDYVPPEPDLPDAWRSEVARELDRDDKPLETWWLELHDPILNDLIERAARGNLDLQIALSRIYEARAQRGIASSRHQPDVELDASYSRSKPSANGPNGALIPPGEEAEAGDLWRLGADVFWELDVFGRIRRTVEAATAEEQASIEDYRDVLVLLYAEVARSYLELRTQQARVAYAEANARAQRETLGLTQNRFEAGLTSALDVAQAESNLASTEADIPRFKAAIEFAQNRLAVLLGMQPGQLDALFRPTRPIPVPDPTVALGLPADLLRRRPDIRRAERQLAAQTARIGVATADLYPTFSLGGLLTLESLDFSDWFDGDSLTWSLIPGIRWSLFNGGRVRNAIKVEEERTEQLLLNYERALLLALEEVENALTGYARELERRDVLRRGVNATERSVELVHTQYISGLVDFQNYLDAQRSLVQQQDQLAISEGQVVLNLISLNKALGGGWAPEGVVAPEERPERGPQE